MTVRLDRLTNGVAVVTAPMPGLKTAAIGIHLDVGARHERAHESGLAHLVEHMVFKGAGARNARALAEDIEDVGGHLNAWTGRDATAYHARVLGDDVGLAFGMLADLLRAPWFDAGDLAQEVGVVLSELGEARDTPDDIVFDHLQAAEIGRASRLFFYFDVRST